MTNVMIGYLITAALGIFWLITLLNLVLGKGGAGKKAGLLLLTAILSFLLYWILPVDARPFVPMVLLALGLFILLYQGFKILKTVIALVLFAAAVAVGYYNWVHLPGGGPIASFFQNLLHLG